jgi:hypothetical protein
MSMLHRCCVPARSPPTHRTAPRAPRRAAAARCPRASTSGAASAPPPFLSAAGPPLGELPHAHDTHAPVLVAPVRVRLGDARALTLVMPTDPVAVETMHALLGEDVRSGS